MSNFLTSSIGQKFLMSLSGLFLISFLFVHLLVNSFLVIDSTGELFNEGAHFMAVNPIIRVVEPVLFAGFILHIVYSLLLTLQNMKARGSEKYHVVNQSNSSSWASRNMFILGAVVLGILVMHLIHFWWKIKFAGHELLEAPVMINGVVNPEI
jgi:succinate dehydrogenase / fumarate reductase, cytochrome b subunit